MLPWLVNFGAETAIPVLIAPPESPARVKATTQTLRPLGMNAPT